MSNAVAQLLLSGSSDTAAKYRMQHMMDASRYLAALCKIVANFVVPINRPGPRYLTYRANPTARR